MRFPLFLTLFVALPLLARPTVTAEPETTTVRTSVVALKQAGHAPYRPDGVWRQVDDPLIIAGQAFAMRPQGKMLVVSEVPGGEPKRRIASGKIVKLRVPQGEQHRVLKLVVERRKDESWWCRSAQGMRARVAGQAITLVDADVDGLYGTLGGDGFCPGDSAFVLPLRSKTVLGDKEIEFESIASEGTTVRYRSHEIPGSRAQLGALKYLNALRLSHGLEPARLDERASSACTAHADYLVANGWDGHSDPHEQVAGAKKATPEGAAVAGRSIIMRVPPRASLDTHYVTFYHRLGMMHPRLVHVGINERPSSLSVIDIYSGRRKGEEGRQRHSTPRFCPADGAVDVPTGSASEFPKEPVPNLAARGFPLMVYFPEAGGEIADFKGTLYLGATGKRRVPALVVAPDHRGVAGLVPERRLGSNQVYRARFEWKRAAGAQSRTIRFETR